MLQIQEKIGLHTHQSPMTKCLAPNIGLPAIAAWWFMEKNAFLTILLMGWKKLQIIRNCAKPEGPCEILLQILNLLLI